MWRFRTRRLLVCLLGAAVAVGTSRAGWAEPAGAPSCPELAQMPFQLRVSDCWLARSVVTGVESSATFNRLVGRIGDLNGIVFVEPRFVVQAETGRVYPGALEHRVVRAGAHRLLFVAVGRQSADESIIVLAHEFQHAIEVLESSAGDERAIGDLFRRIGAQAGAWTYETTAAVDVQREVGKELRRAARTSSGRAGPGRHSGH